MTDAGQELEVGAGSPAPFLTVNQINSASTVTAATNAPPNSQSVRCRIDWLSISTLT